jgi:hypothetical protein
VKASGDRSPFWRANCAPGDPLLSGSAMSRQFPNPSSCLNAGDLPGAGLKVGYIASPARVKSGKDR